MAGKKKIMNAIKQAVSPKPQRCFPSNSVQSSIDVSRTPLTEFICSRLRGNNLQLFALMFAEAIKNDRHAKVIIFENVYKFLGYELYQHAVRQLKRLFPEAPPTPINNLTSSGEVFPGTRGPSKVNYLISVRQFETLMLAAKTEEGALAREMMLDVKDAVQDYMKMEMEAEANARLAANAQLAIEEAKRQELEAVQTHLQATIEAQKKREEKKEARKKQQKEPLETAYLMTNNADSQQGPFKSGCTAGDAKKRAKGMQTGNHEELKVVASVKCMDAELVEKVMHRIFHDYRTNDKLEWFDTDLRSMNSVMRFVARIIDGLNCVNHDDLCVEEALGDVMTVMEAKIFQLSSNCEVEAEEGWPVRDDDLPRAMYGCPQSIMNSSQQLTAENNPFALFRNVAIFSDPAKDAHFRLKDAHNLWTVLSETHEFKTFRPIPKQGDLKTNLSNLLRVPCKDQLWITRPDKTQEKMCGAFRGFSLHSAEYIQQSCDR